MGFGVCVFLGSLCPLRLSSSLGMWGLWEEIAYVCRCFLYGVGRYDALGIVHHIVDSLARPQCRSELASGYLARD